MEDLKLQQQEPQTVDITVPIMEVPKHVYCQEHVDLHLSAEHARVLRSVFLGLDAIGERLDNGTRVANAPGAIRWMLEQVGSYES